MILDEILENIKCENNCRAYTINKKTYTYSEFYKYTCNIYNFLIDNNIKNKTVIVYGGKDVYMKTSFLACSFAGITYVPVDKSMPQERIKEIIKQVKPGLIIGNLKSSICKNINENEIYKIMEEENFKDIDKILMKPEDIYYIIFTSGSTGKPKGVKVTYDYLDSCVKWLKSITNIKEGVILNQANFSFDLSVADLYLSLYTKSEHYIIDDNIKMDFQKLFEVLKNSNTTLAVFTPSFADLLLLDKKFNEELLPNLRTIIFCGEKLLNTTVQKLYSRFKSLKIINTYGPTECTFAVTNIEIPRTIEDNIPIGKPKQDVNIYIVNENLEEVSNMEEGEILITGKSVAKGYVKDIDKNPFIEYKGKHGYLTGDIGYIKDNMLYYKCRKDKQVKYKGYRIELSDIEKNLYELDYVEKTVVIAKKNKDDKVTKIIAFIQLKSNNKIELEKLKKDLKQKIPNYMCPSIKIIDDIPLTKNGKCDEKKLLEEY